MHLTGSTADALLAGRYDAASVATNSVTGTAANVIGSIGDTPNSSDLITRQANQKPLFGLMLPIRAVDYWQDLTGKASGAETAVRPLRSLLPPPKAAAPPIVRPW